MAGLAQRVASTDPWLFLWAEFVILSKVHVSQSFMDHSDDYGSALGWWFRVVMMEGRDWLAWKQRDGGDAIEKLMVIGCIMNESASTTNNFRCTTITHWENHGCTFSRPNIHEQQAVVPQSASGGYKVHQPRLFSFTSAQINGRVYTDFCN